MDWSDITALSALIISLLALYQASRHRRGDNLLAAIKERAELEEMVNGFGDVEHELFKGWQSALVARGMSQSGVMIEKEKIAHQIAERIQEIKGTFATIPKPDGFFARLKAEHVLAQLVTLRAQTNAVSEAVEKERSAIRQNVEDLKNSRR